MSSVPSSSVFNRVLGDFKKDLKKRDIENFRLTTFAQLTATVNDIQAKQHSQRRLQNLNRLKPFLEAIEQYGKVVEVFCNSNDFVAFIWGPIKFLLQIASTYADAFSELLDIYEQIGESLPLFLQYEGLFRTKPHMERVLGFVYKDILKFHRIALHYFQQPLWKQIFDATWKTYKSRFADIISNIVRHRSLVESQATISYIEDYQEARQKADQRFEAQMEKDDSHRLKATHDWLSVKQVDADQFYYSKIRAEYPGTGRWLLDNQAFKNWFDPQYPTIPPLLWLNGIPGAGKTILASLVVEEAQNLTAGPTVLFFYCKHDNPDRDNFIALSRSLLVQLLRHDEGLRLYFYQKCCDSGEAVLTSPALCEELLALAFKNCKSAYIIIDGLDECGRDERKGITQFFRKLVEDLPPSNPDRLRCLFVSQDDGVARKDFAGLSSVKIRTEDNKRDIEEYSRVEAEKLKEQFNLSDEETNGIINTVANSIDGMFLLAKLIWINLSGQTSLAGLEEELKPGVFPKEINAAYRRIMTRMDEQATIARKKDALKLLGWLVCAKRALKWNEIQGLKSTDLNKRTVEFERQGFAIAPKDICDALIEKRPDATIELVHVTAKYFLIDDGHVNLQIENMKMTCSCIDYLNLPAFVEEPTEAEVLKGSYSFMEYAVLHWIQHLETGIGPSRDQTQLMNQIAESLEVFLELHWNSPKITVAASKRISEKFHQFSHYPYYDKLVQALLLTKRQLKTFGNFKREEQALDLVDIVSRVRKVLEHLLSSAPETSIQQDIQKKYGDNLFKCARLNCRFFTTGFSSVEDRDKHSSKHERPYQCTVETCTGFIFGFTSLTEQQKHFRDTHVDGFVQNQEFPTDQDVQHSINNTAAEIQSPASVNAVESSESEVDQDIDKNQDQDSNQDQDPNQDQDQVQDQEPSQGPKLMVETRIQTAPPAQKRQRQTEFVCEDCHKVYKRRYNLLSHRRSHAKDRPFQCETCSAGFVRRSDLVRHCSKHTGRKNHVCRGCGRSFARADILANHHKSKKGGACLRPPLEERKQEREQESLQRQEPQVLGNDTPNDFAYDRALF